MDWDQLAEEKAQILYSGWVTLFLKRSPALALSLAQQHHTGVATEASKFTTGSYNMCCTVTFENGDQVLVRFPALGRSRFRFEKTSDELLNMSFLARFTQIPLPTVLGTGFWAGGPYIITSVIKGTVLSQYIGDPLAQSPSLNPDISGYDLERAYQGMARVILELSKPVFKYIGALQWESRENSKGGWRVNKRPLTLNMNELVRVGNAPPNMFPERVFRTASEYFTELAEQQFLHLKYQRNNAVKNEYDCKKKYVARCLFRKIAQQISEQEYGPFHLYCDDLRPSNVLVSEMDLAITGVIDWEYTYVAPAEFAYTAPWWLLLESPEA